MELLSWENEIMPQKGHDNKFQIPMMSAGAEHLLRYTYFVVKVGRTRLKEAKSPATVMTGSASAGPDYHWVRRPTMSLRSRA